MSFIPNTRGRLSRKVGNNVYNEAVFSEPKTVECGVVHLRGAAQKTSVRTDSSASRGNAEEVVAAAKILFQPHIEIGLGDRFEIAGLTLRVTSIQPRIAVTGQHDHNEVEFEVWTE